MEWNLNSRKYFIKEEEGIKKILNVRKGIEDYKEDWI